MSINRVSWKKISQLLTRQGSCRSDCGCPCSSDPHAMHGRSGRIQNRILGHEAVGEVVEVGSLVKNFHPDDVVVPCCTPNWTEKAMQKRGGNNAHESGMMKSFKF